MGTAVVFSGGPVARPLPGAREPVVPTVIRDLAPDLVVAADSGLDLARSLGWQVDLVVGDMDSVDPASLAEAAAAGARVERHPVDKDATDLELALDAAAAAGVTRVVVVGSSSGRMDHLLASALVMAGPRFAEMHLEGWLGGALVVPVHDRRTIGGTPGSPVSLLAVHGPAHGVTTAGLRWALEADRLDPGSTRGVSNEFVESVATVSVVAGTLIVVVPEHDVDEQLATPRTESEKS